MSDTQVAAAMAAIIAARRCSELQERIAAAWSAERERRNSRTIGDGVNLEIELRKLLKFTAEQARAATERYLNRDYQQVCVETTLEFARELLVPPARSSRIRPIEEVRASWSPHDSGEQEDLRPTAPPARRPAAQKRGGLVA